MTISAKTAECEIEALLKEWCDALIRYQVRMPGNKSFDGGILCPACMLIHGRCPDAVYPLLCMADRTGDGKYLEAALRLFDWGENMLCDDGSVYNDAQATWAGITVFAAVSLHDSLVYHGHLLTAEQRTRFEKRLSGMGDWLYKNLRPGMSTNINYFATNAAAMALLGKYFDNADYIALARNLADHCTRHISPNKLLFGEGQPNDKHTVKDCTAIDVGGYNVEESLPSLYRYAEALGDERIREVVLESYRAHLEWMMPDGAWDNSVGTRTFKWTYWGSRTSDGCQEAFFDIGRTDPVFAEAAWRNFELYRRCTHDGLLHGGPDYRAHGEEPCTHHTFCHAKALAGALDGGLYDLERMPLPSERSGRLRYWSEMDTYRVVEGPWHADVTAYDFDYMRGGHASGGAMSLLWHDDLGPVIASGTVDYTLHEAHNQQLSLKKAEHRCTCPRIELSRGKTRYGQHYDFAAKMTAEEAADAVRIHADAFLCDDRYQRIDCDGAVTLDYTFAPDSVTVRAVLAEDIRKEATFYLPVISGDVSVTAVKGSRKNEPVPMFNLNPGFMGTEYTFVSDADGVIEVKIARK